jgi:hypothetical protein
MSEYDSDILTWSEHQSDLLRRLARGEQVNTEIDWENVAEEIESVGPEQLHAVESLLLRALIHMLKAQAWPDSRVADVWSADALNFRAQATNRFVPSMRQRIDLSRVYRLARRAIPPSMHGKAGLPLPGTCPTTLDELLTDDQDAQP